MKHISVYKDTEEDFCPSYLMSDGSKLVLILFIPPGPTSSSSIDYLISVCGDDDYSLDKRFESEKKAWCCFLEIVGQETITKDYLVEIGFSDYG